LDTESTCGVCGGSLAGVTSEPLEQLVHKQARPKPTRKLNLGSLALVIFAIAATFAGASLLFFNGIGVILLLVGLLAILVIVGGAGGPLKTGVGWKRKRAMTYGEEEVRGDAEERKKRTGEED